MKQIKIRHLGKNPSQSSSKTGTPSSGPALSLNVEPKDCLPESFEDIKIKNFNDLVNLGYDNLQGFLRQWRESERRLSHEINQATEVVKFLQDNPTLSDLQTYARNFDHPTGAEWILDYTDPSMPAPIEHDGNPRENNTTDLNICGWCRFCHRGWGRQNCSLSGNCRLAPWFDDTVHSILGPCQFNRPCFFLKLAQKNPDSFLECALYEADKALSRLRLERQRLTSIINTLTCAKNRSDHRTVFCDLRRPSYLEPGAHVEVLLAGSCYPISGQDRATTHDGIVMPNQYKHEFIHPESTSERNLVANLCVAVQMGDTIVIKLKHPVDGITDNCLNSVSYSTPHVLTRQDFEYLQQHHDYAKIWLDHLYAKNHPEQALFWAHNLGMSYQLPQANA